MPALDENIQRQIAELRTTGLTPKEISRKLALRPSEVSDVIRRQAEARAQGTEALARPLAACLVSPGWASGLILDEVARAWPGAEESREHLGGMVIVLVARVHRYDSVQAATYLLDTWCLGAKSVIPPKTLGRQELNDFAQKSFSRIGVPLVAPLEVAQNLVLGAEAYARSLGFEPDPDLERSRSLLGDWAGPGHVQFGRKGKPFFINGPNDDVGKVLATLNRSVGKGNFDCTLMDGGP